MTTEQQNELAAASARMLAGVSLAEMQAGAAPYAQVNAWLSAAIDERDSMRARNARLMEALREVETICTESAADCRKRMGTRPGNCIVVARAALAATGSE